MVLNAFIVMQFGLYWNSSTPAKVAPDAQKSQTVKPKREKME